MQGFTDWKDASGTNMLTFHLMNVHRCGYCSKINNNCTDSFVLI